MADLTLELLRAYLEERTPARITEAGTIEAAVALVLAPDDRGMLELLLIKRAEDERDPWSGQIALPGGRRDPGDETLLETAIRETREETGIELSPGELLGELDDLHPRTPVLPPVVVRPFVFGIGRRRAVVTNREATMHLWAALTDLRAGAATSRVAVRGTHLEVPSYVIQEHVVWGMTERILKPIIDLAR